MARVSDFEFSIRGDVKVLTNHPAYFSTTAPVGTNIAWDIYKVNNDGSREDKDFDFYPDKKTFHSNKNLVKLSMPLSPGVYIVKVAMNQCC